MEERVSFWAQMQKITKMHVLPYGTRNRKLQEMGKGRSVRSITLEIRTEDERTHQKGRITKSKTRSEPQLRCDGKKLKV